MKLFDALLRKLIRKGTLTVIDANGNRYRYGEASDVARVTIRFTDPATPWHASFNPSLELGEAHRDGRMLVEEGDITAFLNLVGRHTRWDDAEAVALRLRRPGRRNRRLEEWNWQRRARRNAPIIKTFAPAFSRSSSARTCNSAAAIFRFPRSISTPRNSPSRHTLPPSSICGGASARSISAAAGAGLP